MTPALVVDMLSSRQQAYLDAMDIGVWSLRRSAVPANGASKKPVQPEPKQLESVQLKLGPGGGGVLLICAADNESASRLANDINRALGRVPVWAWPCADSGSVELARAIDDKLFTTVAIFGEQLASQFFDAEPPGCMNSANLVILPSLQDIQDQAEARRALWVTFCRSGMLEAG